MRNTRFYICSHCRSTVEMVYDTDIKHFCRCDKMQELAPNTVEASGEKHIPGVNVKDGIVEVNAGSVDHPMVNVRWIEWGQLFTDKGSCRRWLNPGEAPHVTFMLGGEKPLAVYAYCNLHGLWKTERN